MRHIVVLSLFAFLGCGMATAKADDGYRLWLRYDELPSRMIAVYRPRVTAIVVTGNSATLNAIRGELVNGLVGLLGSSVPAASDINKHGAVVVGTPRSSTLIAGLHWEKQLPAGSRRFSNRTVRLGGHSGIVIAAEREWRALWRVSLPALDANAAAHQTVWTSVKSRVCNCACSIIGTISTAASSVATRDDRFGTGATCRTQSIRDCATMRELMLRSASTDRCSTT